MIFELIVRKKETKKKYNNIPANTFGIKEGYYSQIGIFCLVLAHKDNMDAINFINDNCLFKNEAKNYYDKMSKQDKEAKFQIEYK